MNHVAEAVRRWEPGTWPGRTRAKRHDTRDPVQRLFLVAADEVVRRYVEAHGPTFWQRNPPRRETDDARYAAAREHLRHDWTAKPFECVAAIIALGDAASWEWTPELRASVDRDRGCGTDWPALELGRELLTRAVADWEPPRRA